MGSRIIAFSSRSDDTGIRSSINKAKDRQPPPKRQWRASNQRNCSTLKEWSWSSPEERQVGQPFDEKRRQ